MSVLALGLAAACTLDRYASLEEDEAEEGSWICHLRTICNPHLYRGKLMSYLYSRGTRGSEEMRAILLAKVAPALGSSITHQGGNIWILAPDVSDGQTLAGQGPTYVFAKSSVATSSLMAEGKSLQAMSEALAKARQAVQAGEEEVDGSGREADVAWGMVPRVHTLGVTAEGEIDGVAAGQGYLVTDYKDISGRLTGRTQSQLGRTLALMHKYGTSENGQYGFDIPTYCGDTKQDNTWTTSWVEFFADRRILPLVKETGDQGLLSLEKEMRARVYPHLFNASVRGKLFPAIQHGDLWAGNAAVEEGGQAVVYDAASFYGHNECDLGMMHMFGGFTSQCFHAYHQVLPRAQPGYDQRVRLYELYHHLNHAVLFGWGYTSGAKSMMRELVEWGKTQDRRARA